MEHRRTPPHRVDEQGVLHVAPRWESLVDRQIREAMEEGKFDDLPHQGRRIPLEDETYAGEWAMAFHVLHNAGVAPPWIEADKEVRERLAQREAILERAERGGLSGWVRRRDRADLERVVVALNAAVARLNAEAPTDAQHRRPLSLADELDRLDALHAADHDRR
jgi:hypothetical protein